MIAAKRRRAGAPFSALQKRLARWTRWLDRTGDRALQRAHPLLLGLGRSSARGARRAWQLARPLVVPPLALFFSGLAYADSGLRRLGGGAARIATAASEVLSPRRTIGLVMAATGVCLIVAQFIDYRGVEIGLAGYKGLEDLARPPAVDVKVAGEAHSYLLVVPGAAAIVFGALCVRRENGRAALATIAMAALSLAVILLVDLPAGLDAGAQTSRFAGASAVLQEGFYAELAASGAMLIAGLLYYARPCRIRTNSSGRAASARRRRPRRRASSQARVARSA